MFKSELMRTVRNPISQIVGLLIMIIPIIDVILILRQQRFSGNILHPAQAFFLSGSSIGHGPQTILIWFLPIFLLILISDNAVQDFKTGYRNILISRIGKKAYFNNKFKVSFTCSFFIIFISIMLNYLIVNIVFYNGAFSSAFLNLTFEEHYLFEFSKTYPLLAMVLYALFFSIIAGLVGMLGTSISLLFLDKKFVYAATFFIWFLLVLKKNSILLLIQPFSEYTFSELESTFYFSLFILLIIPIMIYFYGVKWNED